MTVMTSALSIALAGITEPVSLSHSFWTTRNRVDCCAGASALIQKGGRMPTIEVPWGPDGSLELLLPVTGPFAGAEIDVVMAGHEQIRSTTMRQRWHWHWICRSGRFGSKSRLRPALRSRSWSMTRRAGRRCARHLPIILTAVASQRGFVVRM